MRLETLASHRLISIDLDRIGAAMARTTQAVVTFRNLDAGAHAQGTHRVGRRGIVGCWSRCCPGSRRRAIRSAARRSTVARLSYGVAAQACGASQARGTARGRPPEPRHRGRRVAALSRAIDAKV